jgi:hypothetical protein
VLVGILAAKFRSSGEGMLFFPQSIFGLFAARKVDRSFAPKLVTQLRKCKFSVELPEPKKTFNYRVQAIKETIHFLGSQLKAHVFPQVKNHRK